MDIEESMAIAKNRAENEPTALRSFPKDTYGCNHQSG
jgi:hypothetical protein